MQYKQEITAKTHSYKSAEYQRDGFFKKKKQGTKLLSKEQQLG